MSSTRCGFPKTARHCVSSNTRGICFLAYRNGSLPRTRWCSRFMFAVSCSLAPAATAATAPESNIFPTAPPTLPPVIALHEQNPNNLAVLTLTCLGTITSSSEFQAGLLATIRLCFIFILLQLKKTYREKSWEWHNQ